MPDRTVNEITDAAYAYCGIKSGITTVMDARALSVFQNMLSLWSISGLLVPYYVTENFTLIQGQAVYTIGVTGDSPNLVTSTGRPVKITDAFIRVSNVDYPIDVLMTKSEYNRLTSKDTEGRPRRLWYDPQYPKGTIRFDYEAESALDFHLVSEKPLLDVAAKTATLSLPLGINEPLETNIAIRLAAQRGINLKPQIFRLANEGMSILENHNANEKLDPVVRLDPAITRGNRSSTMNINTGE